MYYWIPVDELYDAFDCDVCDAMVSKPYKYCPKCGTEYAGINMFDGTLINLETSITNKYTIGEIYWASNLKAGKNKQSNGKLLGWLSNNIAILFNKKWGVIYATLENLEEHN